MQICNFYDFILLSSDRLVMIMAIYLSLGSLWLWLFLLNFCMRIYHECYHSHCHTLFEPISFCCSTLSLSLAFFLLSLYAMCHLIRSYEFRLLLFFLVLIVNTVVPIYCHCTHTHTHTLSRTHCHALLRLSHLHKSINTHFCSVHFYKYFTALRWSLLFFILFCCCFMCRVCLLVFLFLLFCPSSSRSFFSFFLGDLTGFCLFEQIVFTFVFA